MAAKLNIEIVNNLVIQKNGTLISNKYKNINTRVKIKCNKCEEIFILSVKKLKNGHWCKFCNISKPQKAIYYIIKGLYPNYTIKNNYKRFSWLKTSSGGKQEIDIFVYNKDKTFTLAIEYDGEQHFKPISFGKTTEEQKNKDFAKRQNLDKLKNKKIANHKKDIKYFIRFDYTETITIDNVVKKLKDNEIPINE